MIDVYVHLLSVQISQITPLLLLKYLKYPRCTRFSQMMLVFSFSMNIPVGLVADQEIYLKTGFKSSCFRFNLFSLATWFGAGRVVAVVPTKFGNQTHALTCLNGSPVSLDQIVSIIRSTVKLLYYCAPKSPQALKSIYVLTDPKVLPWSKCSKVWESEKAIIYLDAEYRSESMEDTGLWIYSSKIHLATM